MPCGTGSAVRISRLSELGDQIGAICGLSTYITPNDPLFTAGAFDTSRLVSVASIVLIDLRLVRVLILFTINVIFSYICFKSLIAYINTFF